MSLAAADLDRVVKLRLFFGHQSIGQNILDGVRAVVAERSLAWGDALIGQNGAPETKLAAFREQMMNGMGRETELALLKLCYVDFNAATDVRALFDSYKRAMTVIAAECPRTALVHVTVPLTTVTSGAKAWLKRRLGASVWGELENDKRHAFNELLRREYHSRSIFDLAEVESGDPEHPQRYEFRGKLVPKLRAEYSEDGAHLNAEGRRVVGTELLRFLAGAL
ncbi:MAG TPA: hypothetical protein VHB79_23885 [Polyangiaceae bacterium]|nr:hypothetical protein [Polyangiaceae bacterium]